MKSKAISIFFAAMAGVIAFLVGGPILRKFPFDDLVMGLLIVGFSLVAFQCAHTYVSRRLSRKRE